MTQGGYPGGQQQGGYNQVPPYNPGGYSPPPSGYGPSYGPAAGGRLTFGATGFVLAVLGAIAGAVAFTATDWFSGNADSKSSDVKDFLDKLDRLDAANTVSQLYFSWLGWALLAAGAAIALAANLPSSASSALRPLGVLLGLAGVAVTLMSLKIISDDSIAADADAPGSDWIDYLKDAGKSPSLYLAIGAFLLIAVGASIGPKRH